MRSKSIVLLVLALGCGLVASIGISQVMDAQNKGGGDQGEKQPVFVALADINANDQLTAQNIKLEQWPRNIVPQGALTKLEETEGKRTKIKIYAGEPILASKLLGENEVVGAAKEIPPGMRVAYVKVDTVAGASNLILPGDNVDVLVFRQTNADTSAVAAKVVLQNIKVFAVDTHTETEYNRSKGDQSEPMSAKTIALLVTPKQAVVLHTASEINGSVRLVLRHPEDDTIMPSATASISDIFGGDIGMDPNAGHRDDKDKDKVSDKDKGEITQWLDNQSKTADKEPAVAQVLPPNNRKMTVIYGSQVTQVEFPANGDPPITQGGIGGGGSPAGNGPSLISPPPAAPPVDEQDQDTDDADNPTQGE